MYEIIWSLYREDPETRNTDRGKPEVYPAGKQIRKEPAGLPSLFFNLLQGVRTGLVAAQPSTGDGALTTAPEAPSPAELEAINPTN